MFFFSVCSPSSPRSLGRSSPNLVGRLRAAPDISSRGSFFERSRSSRSKSNLCVFFCLFLPGPWADLHQTWWEGCGWHRILARGVHFLKVKVIEVKGQISVSPRSLGRSSPNMEGTWRAATDISLRGSFLKGQGHQGQRTNLCCFFFCLFPYFSQVLGPIFTKLGGKVEGGTGY